MEDIAALRALGLTEYGARAYAALVGLREAGASAIAEAAPVPRTKIYAVLRELENEGWVEAGGGRPRAFRAVDPARRIGDARRLMLETIDAAETRLSALYEAEGVKFAGPMWVLAGPAAIQRRLLRIVSEAHREIFVSLPWALAGDDALLSALARAAQNRIHVRVLVPPEHADLPRLRALPVEVRVGIAPLRVHFVDDRHALVCFRRMHAGGKVEHRGIWNPHSEMVAQLREVGDTLWMAAGARREGAP